MAESNAERMREYHSSFQYTVPVRFRAGEKSYTFGTDLEGIHKGDRVVVETVRGLELGTAAADAVSSEGQPAAGLVKPIVRRATEHDLQCEQRNRMDEAPAMEKCRAAIERLGLPMTLISARYTLDRARLVFTYVADERVDFRELLRTLAATFHTRIELRQIGPRDKAKMVGGIGVCGMPLCCARFQKDFGVISINMAKNQLLALNPQKLSGQCGKLMCCLAYENEDYKVLREGLPKMNSSIIYEGKRYRITSMNVLEGSARLSNMNEVVDMKIEDLKKIIAYNAEHNITTQGFMKAQREKELEDARNGIHHEKEKPHARIHRVVSGVKDGKEEPAMPPRPAVGAGMMDEQDQARQGEKRKPRFRHSAQPSHAGSTGRGRRPSRFRHSSGSASKEQGKQEEAGNKTQRPQPSGNGGRNRSEGNSRPHRKRSRRPNRQRSGEKKEAAENHDPTE